MNQRITPFVFGALFGMASSLSTAWADSNSLVQTPLFVSSSVPPLNMLVMGRDHKLYYEAYNDASDLDDDGALDVGFKPSITYYGYFNTAACYNHTDGRFEPTAAAGDGNTCSNAWSGNFLNYLATSRMDALRKVLYGGYRAVDGTSETVLRAAFIPQDAHSSGKEYDPARDTFNISDYAPLSTPATGYRHMFAVTTLSNEGTPILRVLSNTQYRIWDWVSKAGPVASGNCVNNSTPCTSAGSDNWAIAPPSIFPNGLRITTRSDNTGSPSNEAEMNNLFKTKNTECGTGEVSSINTTGQDNNPFSGKNKCSHENYHTLITGTMRVPVTGSYTFGVNGDDAVDFYVGSTRVAYWYGGHAANNNQPGGTNSSISLIADTNYTITFRHEEAGGGDSWQLYYKAPNASASTMTDYALNVLACPSDANLREGNCKTYSDSNGNASYKPTGILHDFGENDSMKFGLLTGSYGKNTKGGVLRSNVDSFTREVNSATGQFNSNLADGIVATLDKLRITDFNYSNYQYSNCGWIADVPITSKADGVCAMWGNPLAEMAFEGLRYFAGATAGSSAYVYGDNARDTQSDLGLPAPDWIPPYVAKPNGAGEKSCAVPVMTLISDINPSYDYTLPGSRYNEDSDSFDLPEAISGLNVSTATDAIGTAEGINGKAYFIGQSATGNADNAPTAKVIENLSFARGLSPEEPSKQGTFYTAGITKFAAENAVGGDQKMLTYSIALASPLPQIRFPIGNGSQTVTLVPFAKSVGGGYSINPKSNFQPTNQIVDYYVVSIANTTGPTGADYDASVNQGRPYAQFRINYEDVEQGADHDMDAIVLYTLSVEANGSLKVQLDSEFAAGGIIQLMGYVISGTTADGIYLEVRDQDTNSDHAYKLNTPAGQNPGWCENNLDRTECKRLPLNAVRNFSAAASAPGAGFLKDPLWYAAKYGIPDRSPAEVKGDPSNYFLVTNALTLKDQLTNAFNDIMQRNSSVTSPTISTQGSSTDDGIFAYTTSFDVDPWKGTLKKVSTKTPGQADGEWSTDTTLIGSSRNIKFAADGSLTSFNWDNLSTEQQALLNTTPNGTTDTLGESRVDAIRSSKLGDIINSSPLLVAGANYSISNANNLEGSDNYSDYKSGQAGHSTIYVGANDGMLHAFDAETGGERFAFIPSAVIKNLPVLTADDYGEEGGTPHRYFVDGSPVARDVYFNNEWHKVLLGSLGAGGRSVFALDVTDPDNPELLWEFSNEDDSDMGYSVPTPGIFRLHTGEWAALVPNGYDSGSNTAVLFVLNIETGEVIRKLTATPELEEDESTDSLANGLSRLMGFDINNDGIVDYAYAGDLLGNLWRFDLIKAGSDNAFKPEDNLDPEDFDVSFGGEPLYVARNAAGKRQPITAAPLLTRHPSGLGYIVTFGTGRYLTILDKSDTDQQSLYGIWDRKTAGEATGSSLSNGKSRSSLVKQVFTETTFNGRKAYSLSRNAVDWYDEEGGTADGNVDTWGWYIDFPEDGERLVYNMRMLGNTQLLTTITPSEDPCEAGLTGTAYGIDSTTGGATLYSTFDLDGDGAYDEGFSGFVYDGGDFSISSGSIYVNDGDGASGVEDYAVNAGLTEGRQTWRQLPTKE
ncbi:MULTISPECIES: PilC/PilY family type IV pilus protein [Stutzerimonas]|uniref:PilC/PilY family type IV pilus protein n=1 Tax=Stutzerimonas TaxID=2901164 RepID=UPI0028A15FAC|nr:PilC/PilY family type IV pilus protein [Stutzerimonas kunmingensis]